MAWTSLLDAIYAQPYAPRSVLRVAWAIPVRAQGAGGAIGVALLSAVRICALMAVEKAPWPSNSVTALLGPALRGALPIMCERILAQRSHPSYADYPVRCAAFRLG